MEEDGVQNSRSKIKLIGDAKSRRIGYFFPVIIKNNK